MHSNTTRTETMSIKCSGGAKYFKKYPYHNDKRPVSGTETNSPEMDLNIPPDGRRTQIKETIMGGVAGRGVRWTLNPQAPLSPGTKSNPPPVTAAFLPSLLHWRGAGTLPITAVCHKRNTAAQTTRTARRLLHTERHRHAAQPKWCQSGVSPSSRPKETIIKEEYIYTHRGSRDKLGAIWKGWAETWDHKILR